MPMCYAFWLIASKLCVWRNWKLVIPHVSWLFLHFGITKCFPTPMFSCDNHSLPWVLPRMCAVCVHAIIFGSYLQNYDFDEIESAMCLTALEHLSQWCIRIIILLKKIRIKENILWNLNLFWKNWKYCR